MLWVLFFFKKNTLVSSMPWAALPKPELCTWNLLSQRQSQLSQPLLVLRSSSGAGHGSCSAYPCPPWAGEPGLDPGPQLCPSWAELRGAVSPLDLHLVVVFLMQPGRLLVALAVSEHCWLKWPTGPNLQRCLLTSWCPGPGVAPPWVQNFTLLLAELHEVPTSPFLQPSATSAALVSSVTLLQKAATLEPLLEQLTREPWGMTDSWKVLRPARAWFPISPCHFFRKQERFFLPPGFSSGGCHSFQAPEQPCFTVAWLHEAGVCLEKADLPKAHTVAMQAYPSLPQAQTDRALHFCYSLQPPSARCVKMHVRGWGELRCGRWLCPEQHQCRGLNSAPC